ncbi:MAG: hypothetical protein RMJ28_04520 [Nitrososphaerota archaeon]|nr:hypothetical protein [Candidatus Calditenuaceae archaeon]MDW8073483.1 hypothetical protein [Nitrososphaerota archaeon]
MSRGVRVTREELLRMIAILSEIESSRLDPFSVDVSNLLSRLREIIERERDVETIVLDAETLYRVSVVLGLQQRWIRDRASSLFIDAGMVYTKIIASDPKSLVTAFLQAWRPIVRLEQISVDLLLKGYQHFISRPTRGLVKGEAGPLALSRPGAYEAIESQISSELGALLAELSSMGGWVKYWDFIKAGGDRRARAYLLSYLISRGEVDVRINTLSGEIWIRAAERVLDEPRTVSLALTVGD